MTEQESKEMLERIRKNREETERLIAKDNSFLNNCIAIPIGLGIATPFLILYLLKLLDL